MTTRDRDVAREVADRVLAGVGCSAKSPTGWCGGGGHGLWALAEVVSVAGNGDHCEIGCLFGATAITAALVKKELGLGGTVVCVDPMTWNSQEKCVKTSGAMTRCIVDRMPRIFSENCERFGVSDRIWLLRKSSYPWPDELRDASFSSSFIDGWHYGMGPIHDIESIEPRTMAWILLDDIQENYPDVYVAYLKMCTHPDWISTALLNHTSVFHRRIGLPPYPEK